TYLPDDLLVMADRMSMASSLEVRAPFCDHRIVEQSLALAPATKIPGFRLKGMLKAAYADVLPREVLAHRKQGVMIPLARWLGRAAPGAAGPVSLGRERVRIRQFPVAQGSVARFIRSSILGARHAVTEELAREPVDVLHIHQPLAGYGALASKAAGRLPSLYSFYSPAPLEYRSRRGMTARHLPGVIGATGVAMLWAIERACLRRASLIHVLSDFSAEQLWKLYAVPRERIVTIRGAVATERFRPDGDRGCVRAGLGLPADRTLLLTVRNLEARMGLDTLLDAMAIVRRRRPDARLLIGGAGSLRSSLEARTRALALEDHVT